MKTVTDELSMTFAALADPTRRAILERLRAGEATLRELAEPFDMSLQAVALHLKVLERSDLVTRGRVAQTRPARIAPAHSTTRRNGCCGTGSSGKEASRGSTVTWKTFRRTQSHR